MRKRDVIVLVVVCGLVLLSAGAISMGGRMHAKILMCTVNLQKIGSAMAAYSDAYDDLMPTMNTVWNGSKWAADNCIRVPYLYSIWDASATPNQMWLQLGCLFKAGLIQDGRTFYCPSTAGFMDEYLSYSNPAPWGSNLSQQPANLSIGTGNIWLRATKGYIYWPQSTELLTSLSQLSNNGYSRYMVGRPRPPMYASRLDGSKAMAVDGEGQPDDAGGFKLNALFGDGHVKYQFVPRFTDPATGKRLWICPYQGHLPATALPSEWYGQGSLWNDITTPCNYMYALEP